MTETARYLAVFAALLFLLATPLCAADTATLLNAAIDDYEAEDYGASLEKLSDVVQQDPDNLTAFYYIGAIHYLKGNPEVAIPYLEKVAQSPAPFEGVEGLLAGAHLYAGHFERALGYFSARYAADPGDEAVSFNYAWCLKGVGRVDEAADIFERLIDGQGAYADASRYEMGDILSQGGDYVAAARLFRDVDHASPYVEASQSYLESIAPFARPISVYGSVEYFYDNNPGATSTERTGQSSISGGSQGISTVLLLSTRELSITQDLSGRLEYLFYGNFYAKPEAKDNDFAGHYLNPGLTLPVGPSTELVIKGDAQLLFFNQQRLSTNFGGTARATWTSGSGNQSLNVHAAALRQYYSRHYRSGASTSSLEYLDAWSFSAGLGGELSHGEWGRILSVDYTFLDELTVNDKDAVLGPQASDSRYREHAVRADLRVPFNEILCPLAILGNAMYSHRDYLNRQLGVVYPSATGVKLATDMLTLGVQLELSIWKASMLEKTFVSGTGLTMAFGMEKTNSRSGATELDYKRERYFARLSAYY